MRTAPNDAIAGVRALLRDGIGPELASEQATFLLRRIMAVLRETDWNDAGFALLAENAAFRALAADVAAALGEEPRPDALNAWLALAADGAIPARYEIAAADNAALRTAMAASIDALAGSPAAPAVRRLLVARLLDPRGVSPALRDIDH